jgi:glycosyltransferase involved in cell wall biosynthesis
VTDRLEAFAGLPSSGWLPGPHYFLGRDGALSPQQIAANLANLATQRKSGRVPYLAARVIRPVADIGETTAKLRAVTAHAIRAIEAESPDVVLAPSGDPVFVVAAANAAKATGKPLFVHLFDLLAGNRYTLPKRVLASSAERFVLTQASKVAVPNEAMAGYYRARLGIEPIVVPNGIAVPPFTPAKPAVSTPPTILYTGAIYWAQLDAVRDLAHALRRLPAVRLQLRTGASPLALMRAGVRRDEISVGVGNEDEARQAQRSADLLFLPLSFGGPGRDVIRTALPGKTAEYLVSGTPILVHAPPDAYVSQYARKAGWGYVVDKLDPGALVDAIQELLSNSRLRSDLVEAAYREAATSHDMNRIGPEYVREFEPYFAARARELGTPTAR